MIGPSERTSLPVRVYYEDTDFSGVVYHANYLRYLERGRTEYLRALGVTQSLLHERADGGPALAFAVRDMTLSFQAPARMDDLLTVDTTIGKLGGASVDMLQSVRRDSTVLVTATVRIALVGAGKPQRLPPDLLAKLRAA